MRKTFLIILVATLGVLHISFFFLKKDSISSKLDSNNPDQLLILSKYLYAHQTADKLSTEEKIGQTMFISINGTKLGSRTKQLLDQIRPGGIVLYEKNISTPKQTELLTQQLQKWAKESNIPSFFVAVDEEGGVVERIKFSQAEYTQPQLGKINKEKTTRKNAKAISETLSDLGINTNFAPVADIAFLPTSVMVDRSFGSSVELVSNHTSWSTDEHIHNKIIPTAKHFPGHGRTIFDSHSQLPHINISKKQWLKSDSKPFEAAIKSNTPMIMVGHLKFSEIDNQTTSASKIWLTTILREELKYKNLIIIDDIKMGAISEDLASYSAKSMNAGADMIIVVLSEEDTDMYFQKLTRHQKQYTQNIEDKLIRILSIKYEFGINQ